MTVTFAIPTSSIGKRSIDEEQNRERRQVDETYDILAAFSGGQVLNVGSSEISDLGELVRFSADISRVTLLRESEQVLTSIPYKFPVDSSIDEVIISINGQGYNIMITTPEGKHNTINSCHVLTGFTRLVKINMTCMVRDWLWLQ